MFLGTGSDVGKSIIATAFCRILKNRGYNVAPFKAQNMSNNSYVTIEGGEIGRAQAAQAEAAGILPSVHMNPVLLKPTGQMGSQVIVCGKVFKNLSARDYYAYKNLIHEKVIESYHTLAGQYECIVMEGAGSCCEVNLRKHDIVNFEMAIKAKAPVIIVADIDRGGVFAQIVGSMSLISREEQDLVAGFMINKFRGDPALFQEGIHFIEAKTQKPVFGLIPWYDHIHIDMEDSMSLDLSQPKQSSAPINIAVIRLPHISNFTDVEALENEPEVAIHWLTRPNQIFQFDAIIIPGSKNVIHDTCSLKEWGWFDALHTYTHKKQGMIVGLCGGFQMLGKEIHDPHGVESKDSSIIGIGILDISTEMDTVKVVKKSCGQDQLFHAPVQGYEIHMGKTALGDRVTPFIDLDGHTDGAVSKSETVIGSYFHGLFDSGIFRHRFLQKLADMKGIQLDHQIAHKDYWDIKEMNYDRLADHVSQYCDVEKIIKECLKNKLLIK